MTAQELLDFRHEPYRHELLRGTLQEMEPAGAEHGRVALNIGELLNAHVKAHRLGIGFAAETGFQLAWDPDTVRAPDAAFVAHRPDRLAASRSGFWQGPPDLAFEVVSPNDRYSSVEEKAWEWLDAGARAVVVVDPRRRTAKVYRSRRDIRVLTDDEALDLDDIVAGWAPNVADLFG
jgi:Uma2 family endonuclease